MKHEETHTVTMEHGPRPAGEPDRCFYCSVAIGAEHASDCVCRKRTVVVRATIEYVVQVPASWEPEDILFHRNRSPWCADNLVTEIDQISESDCLCSRTSFEFVREATVEDEIGFFGRPGLAPALDEENEKTVPQVPPAGLTTE